MGGGGTGSREADAEEESQASDGEERERMKESFHGIWTDIHWLLISIFTCEALPRRIRVRGRARALFRIIIHAHISLSAQKQVQTDLHSRSLPFNAHSNLNSLHKSILSLREPVDFWRLNSRIRCKKITAAVFFLIEQQQKI